MPCWQDRFFGWGAWKAVAKAASKAIPPFLTPPMSETAHILLMLATGAFIGWTARKVCCWDEWIAGFRAGVKTEQQKRQP